MKKDTSTQGSSATKAPASKPHHGVRRQVHLDGVSRAYDSRVQAIRPDLADVALADIFFAPHYAASVARGCVAPWATMRGTPDEAASATSELLHGETFHMLDARGKWAWGYCAADHYVGYVLREALGEPIDPDHVTICNAPVFSQADIKSPIRKLLPAKALLQGAREDAFLATAEGYVHVCHVRPIGAPERDWVAVAARYVGTPYVWGGRGGLGIDCSGLVQTALWACGIAAPRDSDQQTLSLGETLSEDAPLQRGDILFFPGHVGLMVDAEQLVHANGHWMATVIEPLADVVARLDDTCEKPITARRRIAA